MKNYYFPKYSKWIFIFLLLLISGVYKYHEILFKPPQSLHLWRQTDCTSIATNYYQNDNAFLSPSVHNLADDDTGRTMSEFPIIYYAVAQLWKLFGHHEFIFRLFNLLIFYIGLFTLFKLFENELKDSILAVLFPLLLFSSPMLVYYANNFLMNVPAFGLGLIALYYFFKFYRTSNNKYLYFMCVFYLFSGLLKITSLLGFFAIFGILVFELIGLFKSDKKIFQQPKKQILPFIIVILLLTCWYLYAKYFNETHNKGIFLVGILPIWDLTIDQIIHHLNKINEHAATDYFQYATNFVLIGIFIITAFFQKNVNKLYLLLSLFLAFGMIGFAMLFFQPLEAHDYYTLNLLITVPAVLLAFSVLLKTKLPFVFQSIWFRIVILLFVAFNVDFAKTQMEYRYNPDGWENEEYIKNLSAYTEIQPYLRSIGITKDDAVISLSDNTINASLYYMNQKGWTNYGVNQEKYVMKVKIDRGAKYLFVHKPEIYSDTSLAMFFQHKIGAFKNIDIYSLSNLEVK